MKLEITITGDTEQDLATSCREAIHRLNKELPKGGTSIGAVTDTWSYNIKAKGKLVRVLVGEFIEFGDFKKGDEFYQLAIVNGHHEIREIYEEDIEEEVGNLDWLVLGEFKGEIVTPMRSVR